MLILRYKKERRFTLGIAKNKYLMLIGAGTLCSFITVSHIAGKYSTLRYVYNLVPLIAVVSIAVVYELCGNTDFRKSMHIALAVCFILNGFLTFADNEYAYLYESESEWTDNIKKFSADSCISINCQNERGEVSTAVPTASLFKYLAFDRIYLTTYDDVINNVDDIITPDMEGTAIYVPTDTEWMNGYDGDSVMSEIVFRSDRITGYERIQEAPFGELYYARCK